MLICIAVGIKLATGMSKNIKNSVELVGRMAGGDLLLYDCDVFPAALHDLYFPQYHAGLRIWIPADDGRCIGAHRETDCLHGGDEAFELSARLFRRSGGMDRSGGIYGCLVSLCDKKDRERA